MQITINSGDSFYSGHGGCLTRLMLLSIAVMVGAWLLPGVTVGSFWAVLLTAIVISLLDNLVRPILIVITLPVTVLTLGLFLFVINAIIILMASSIVNGFEVSGLGSALLFSLILTAVNYLLELPNRYLMRKELKQRRQETGDDTDDEGFTPYEEIKD
ncbi:MAG: phage holin family protein [Bacteroidales bacterium]|jgi:putative membrane protein|nr:phage holin family protein [Bacteroidales bacterium]